jgi:glucosylceramidase
VWGRVPIEADGYALDRYTHDEVPDDFAMDAFSIARDEQYLIPYIEGALEFAPDLRLWALPWTPPTWMKQNGGFDGGSIIESPNVMWAYALYLARFIQAYDERGIDIEALHPQADPEFEFDYPSCLWTSSVLLTFLSDHLIPTLAAEDVGVDLWLGTLTGNQADQWANELMGNSVVQSSVKGFGLQWGAFDVADGVVGVYGWPVMQTEHKPGNFPFINDGTFDPSRAPNDHGHAVESWAFIYEWITAGVNSYSAWNMILDTVGLDLDVVRPWPKSSLLAVDRTTRQLYVTPAYYVFRHLSYFVDPGAVRIGTTGEQALAFQNPDGSIITVVFNPDADAKDVTLAVKETLLEFTVPGQGWATVNWK